MKNNSSLSRLLVGASIAAALLLAAAGCAHHESDNNTSPLAPPPAPSPQAAAPQPKTITLYQVAHNKDQAKLGDANGLIAVPYPVPQGTSPELDALSHLASEPNSPLPKGTKILAVTVDRAGLATADFSPEFQKNFTGGDTQEAQVIDSVLQTLGQFPNVQNVQFLVDGQKIASLGGMQELDEPLPVIRPSQDDSGKQDIAMRETGAGQ